MKKSDIQICAILLLVAFSFFLLTTPAYVLFLYVDLVDYGKTPKSLAGFHLFYNVAHKTLFTNCGINFFLYVISGKKFRTDLVKLFVKKRDNSTVSVNDSNTRVSTVDGRNQWDKEA